MTIQLGEALMNEISEEIKKRWNDMIENTDLSRNGKRGWATIRKFNSEGKPATRTAAQTPNEVAYQLLKNGKP